MTIISVNSQISPADTSRSFYYLLAILFFLPLPLGANIAWAWSLFEIAIFSLTFFVVVKRWSTDKLGIKEYFSSIYFWLAFILLGAIQIIPLPNFIVALLSPTSLDLFSGVSAHKYFISVNPTQSLISFIKLLSFFCLFVCVLSLINTEKRIRLLLMTMVLTGVLQATYGIAELLFGASSSLIFNLPVFSSASGSFAHSNHYANFLVLSLAPAVGLLVTTLEKPSLPKNHKHSLITSLSSNKATILTCIGLMLIGLIMSGSRMGVVAFFVVIALVGAVAFTLIKNRSKGVTVLMVSMFIMNLFIVSAYFGLERVNERLSQTSTIQETRDDIVSDAYPIISDFPLFGAGAGSFQSTFPSYQNSEVAGVYQHLRNDYIQFLIEYGILGGFILFSLFSFCVYKSMRAMLRRRNSIFKGSAFSCLMVFMGMGIFMLMDYPLQSYANANYFVVFLALSMVINSLRLHPPKRSRTR